MLAKKDTLNVYCNYVKMFCQWFDLIFNSRHCCVNFTFSTVNISQNWMLMLQAFVSLHSREKKRYIHTIVIVLLYNSAKYYQNRFRIKKI